MARFFTKAEADRLIKEVQPAMEDALRLKAEYQHLEAELQDTRRRVMLNGGVQLDRSEFLETKRRSDSCTAGLRAAIDSIHGFGCIVKDLDSGLVDFPTVFHGREVYLCWKLGEPGVQFWHGVEEGFQGRKPIDRDFLANHRGDQAN